MVIHMTTPTVTDPIAVRVNRTRVHCHRCHLQTMPAVTVTFAELGISWAFCPECLAAVHEMDEPTGLTIVRVDDHRTPDERLVFVDGVGTVLLPSLNEVRS